MNYLALLEPWLKTLAVFVGVVIFLGLTRRLILYIITCLTKNLSFDMAEIVEQIFEKPIKLFIFTIGFYYALYVSPFNYATEYSFVQNSCHTAAILSFFWICYNFTSSTNGFLVKTLNKMGLGVDPSLGNIISAFIHFVIIMLGFAMIVSEWGYNINGFIAGLSIGGLAVSMAAKDTLGNVISGMIILTDKPFSTGDWIVCNGIEGTVEKIYFRSTSIRTFPQALVYIPNSLLTNTPITNYTRRDRRRIDVTVGVVYSTTPEQIQQIMQKAEAFLYQNQQIFDEGISVVFSKIDASSLNIALLCYTSCVNYNEYIKVVETINFKLMNILAEVGTSAAYPSTSIYMETPINYKTEQ